MCAGVRCRLQSLNKTSHVLEVRGLRCFNDVAEKDNEGDERRLGDGPALPYQIDLLGDRRGE